MSTSTLTVSPSPALLAQRAAARAALAVVLRPDAPARCAVVKAKHLRPGMTVRAWLHEGPRGGVRVVHSVTRVGDGATVIVGFAHPEPTTEYKAAYRFQVVSA